MKTAVYTICKNEIKNVERWLHYGSFYDYRVLLDTGSTDGTWELLQKFANNDKNLIIEQKTFDPWDFSVARNYNLAMVPNDVEWCLSPDLDEFFTKNTLNELMAAYKAQPAMTNLSCDRIDVYSDVPRVGPPNYIPTNKIHKRHDYIWVQPIYEHLKWKHDSYENELYSSNIYLIHDQDFNNDIRSPFYVKMLIKEHKTNPTNIWCLWFLVNHYFKNKELENFIDTACDFITYHDNKLDVKYIEVLDTLKNIYRHKSDDITEPALIKLQNTLTNS